MVDRKYDHLIGIPECFGEVIEERFRSMTCVWLKNRPNASRMTFTCGPQCGTDLGWMVRIVIHDPERLRAIDCLKTAPCSHKLGHSTRGILRSNACQVRGRDRGRRVERVVPTP